MRTLSEILGLDLSYDELTAAADLVLPMLVARATVMLRGRVAVPFDAWASWHPVEQEALAIAGDRVRALEAFDHALAARSGPSAARVLARADGGEVLVRLELEQLVDEVTLVAAGAAPLEQATAAGAAAHEHAVADLLGVARVR